MFDKLWFLHGPLAVNVFLQGGKNVFWKWNGGSIFHLFFGEPERADKAGPGIKLSRRCERCFWKHFSLLGRIRIKAAQVWPRYWTSRSDGYLPGHKRGWIPFLQFFQVQFNAILKADFDLAYSDWIWPFWCSNCLMRLKDMALSPRVWWHYDGWGNLFWPLGPDLSVRRPTHLVVPGLHQHQ